VPPFLETLTQFASHVELGFKRQFKTFKHHVPVYPLEQHFPKIIRLTFTQKRKRTKTGEGELSGKGLRVVTEIDQISHTMA
jgi:hypothetical protein